MNAPEAKPVRQVRCSNAHCQAKALLARPGLPHGWEVVEGQVLCHRCAVLRTLLVEDPA